MAGASFPVFWGSEFLEIGNLWEIRIFGNQKKEGTETVWG